MCINNVGNMYFENIGETIWRTIKCQISILKTVWQVKWQKVVRTVKKKIKSKNDVHSAAAVEEGRVYSPVGTGIGDCWDKTGPGHERNLNP
jgi:hypothetical protein